MMRDKSLGLFVSGVGTAVGKTFVSRGLIQSIRAHGLPVAGLKPIETGCIESPADALALARSSGDAGLAHHADFYRARAAVSPYAASLRGEPPVPPTGALVRAVQHLAPSGGALLVEGAGGLLVPLDAERTIADLARALGLPLLLVARDELGVLSAALTCLESARARALEVAALILVQHGAPPDPSTADNATILARLAGCPVVSFPACRDDDDALRRAAVDSGLARLALARLDC